MPTNARDKCRVTWPTGPQQQSRCSTHFSTRAAGRRNISDALGHRRHAPSGGHQPHIPRVAKPKSKAAASTAITRGIRCDAAPPHAAVPRRRAPPQTAAAATPHRNETPLGSRLSGSTPSPSRKNIPSTRRLNTYGSMSTSQFLVPRCVAHFSIFWMSSSLLAPAAALTMVATGWPAGNARTDEGGEVRGGGCARGRRRSSSGRRGGGLGRVGGGRIDGGHVGRSVLVTFPVATAEWCSGGVRVGSI